ncbi:monooxygenase 2-like [Diospyros lotus]|uniref:monooxygenase 2-like n=1 Tax=Diospyros lotus TaxID=55363 RepID=UPI00225A7758|nr:monooxygenase 2-like [Diospyros lotus]
MEITEDIVIVGGGIAGLTTSLGLHRLGLKSLVLESSDKLRVTGFALTLWTNAWRALDAVGVANSLRQHYPTLPRFQVNSSLSGLSSELSPNSKGGDNKDYEIRCVRRKELLETLEGELPRGAIRYSSMVVSIEDLGFHKLLRLADGSTVKTKVLIGCDGVNSRVAKWLGFENPVDSGRSAIRGLVEYPDGHSFQPRFHVFFGGGVRFGFLPCGEKSIYWFCTIHSSLQHDVEDMEENPLKMKQFVLRKISKIPKEAADVVERTKLDCISCSPLKLRLPWHVLLGNITKSNVCVAGDAFHPMTPDIGQGGCSALEDGVVLARCLGEALLERPREEEEEEYERIKKGLEKYAKQRRWRSFKLISTAALVGFIQESDARVMTFLREKLLSGFSVGAMWKMADFDCGDLYHS